MLAWAEAVDAIAIRHKLRKRQKSWRAGSGRSSAWLHLGDKDGRFFLSLLAIYSRRKEEKRRQQLPFLFPICGIPGSHGNPADATGCTLGPINGPRRPTQRLRQRRERRKAAVLDARRHHRRRRALSYILYLSLSLSAESGQLRAWADVRSSDLVRGSWLKPRSGRRGR